MAKTRVKKEQEMAQLEKKFKEAKTAVFANFNGLKVKDVEELRQKCRTNKVDYIVVKKTLLKKSLEASRLEQAAVDDFRGGVAAAFGYEDEITPAKILNDFSKNHEALKLIGGFLEGNYMAAEQVIALAKLPGRQELLTQIVGSLQAPISGLVNVLAGNLRGLVQVLKAIQESRPQV